MAAASAPMFGVFAWWQRRKARSGGSPLVVPALFTHRSFSLGLVISLLVSATIGCFGLTFSLLLQLGQGFSAIHTVLTALFLTAGMVLAAGAGSKKAIPAMGRRSLTAGTTVMALGTGAVAIIAGHAGPHLSTWQLAPALFVMGTGMGLVFVPLLPFILSSMGTRTIGLWHPRPRRRVHRPPPRAGDQQGNHPAPARRRSQHSRRGVPRPRTGRLGTGRGRAVRPPRKTS